jgi:hypothetical protein
MSALDLNLGLKPALVLAPGMLSDAAVWGPQERDLVCDADVWIAQYGEARTLEAMARRLQLQNAN